MAICEYKLIDCPYWCDEELACQAISPHHCPYNAEGEAETVVNWQRETIERAIKKGNE